MPLYKCYICNYNAKTKSNLNKHLKTKKHKEIYLLTKNEIIFNTSKNQISNDSHKTPIGSINKRDIDNDSKIKSNYICNYCNRTFTRSNNLGRHLKTCISKKKFDEENELKNQLKLKDKEMENYKLLKEKEINNYKQKEENYKKEIENNKENYKEKEEHYKKEIEYYRKLLENAGNILLQKSISTINFVSNSYIIQLQK